MLFITSPWRILNDPRAVKRRPKNVAGTRPAGTRLWHCSAQPETSRKRVAITELVTEIVLSFDQVRIVTATGRAGAAVLETTFPLLAEGAHVRTFQTATGRDASSETKTTQVVSVLTPDRSFELHLDSSRVKTVQFARELPAKNRGRTASDLGPRTSERPEVEAVPQDDEDKDELAIHSIRWLDANGNLIMNMVVGAPTTMDGKPDARVQRLRSEAIAVWTAMRAKYGEWLEIGEEM